MLVTYMLSLCHSVWLIYVTYQSLCLCNSSRLKGLAEELEPLDSSLALSLRAGVTLEHVAFPPWFLVSP